MILPRKLWTFHNGNLRNASNQKDGTKDRHSRAPCSDGTLGSEGLKVAQISIQRVYRTDLLAHFADYATVFVLCGCMADAGWSALDVDPLGDLWSIPRHCRCCWTVELAAGLCGDHEAR